MGNFLGRKGRKQHKDQAVQCDLDTTLRTDMATLRATILDLEEYIFTLETAMIDQEDRMTKYKRNDHRAYPGELHANPLFVTAKSVN